MKPNRLIQISSVDHLLRWWNFFKEGLHFLNTEQKWGKTNEQFLEALLYIVSNGEENGFVSVLVSGAGQPYGFIVVANNTTRFSDAKTCNIYAIYTNQDCRSTVAELSAEAFQWAKTHSYKLAQACSHRVNGAAIRWFQKKMRFDRMFVVFTKEL